MSQVPKKSTVWCDDKETVNAMIEYAVKKGFMTRCVCEGEEHYHYEEIFKHVDEIVMMAKEEGLVVLYEDNGTCYILTDKGRDWYSDIQKSQGVKQK